MNEKADTLSGTPNPTAPRFGEAPDGLDLHPRPPRPVRVSKRAAGALMALAAIILGLFAYGGYKRQQRQVAALAEGNTPSNVSPATAAGVDIAKDIPTGNLPNASTLRGAPSESGTLVPPGELQAGQAAQQIGGVPGAGGQVFVRQAPMPAQPVAAQIPQPREPSPEERRLLAAYEREQQAIAAPTTLREGFGAAGSGTSPQAGQGGRSNGDDAAQIASMVQALIAAERGSQVTPRRYALLVAHARKSGNETGDIGDQNMQERKESFLTKARAGQMDDYLKSHPDRTVITVRNQSGLGDSGNPRASVEFRSSGRTEGARVVERLRHRHRSISADPARRAPGRRLQLENRLRPGWRPGDLGPRDLPGRLVTRSLRDDRPGRSRLLRLPRQGGPPLQAPGRLRSTYKSLRRSLGDLPESEPIIAHLSESRTSCRKRSWPTSRRSRRTDHAAKPECSADDQDPVGYRFNVRVNRDILFDGPTSRNRPGKPS